MRLIRALKTLLMNYNKIIPIFLVVAVTTGILSNIVPLIGMVLLLPLKISVAYAMLTAIKKPHLLTPMPLNVGLKRKYYLKNVYYMLFHQFLYLLPAFIGVVISGLIYQYVEFDNKMALIIVNLVIFAIPSAILSLMLSMVPYLLADPRFDQRKRNPLYVSARLLKGHYIRLIGMRLFFTPWILWFTSGFLVTLFSLYNISFAGSESIWPWLSISWLMTYPIKWLLLDPWYLMIHADLYVYLRKTQTA